MTVIYIGLGGLWLCAAAAWHSPAVTGEGCWSLTLAAFVFTVGVAIFA